MTGESAKTIYLRLHKRIKVSPQATVKLGDIAQLIADEGALPQLKKLPIREINKGDGTHVILDIYEVIAKIKTVFKQNDVEYLGDPEIILEIEESVRKPPLVAVLAVWFLLFVGSGLAIMNFHTDVAMKQVHQRIYYLITGEHEKHPYILQIPYSLGIGMGMVIFFNLFFKKRINDEPSPLEVEMFLYQQNVDQYMIAEERRMKREKDGAPS